MFSEWFSGGDCERYRTSPHKQRIDQVGSSLVQLRYASEVIRQHLHEWLRFSLHLEKNGSGPEPTLGDDAVRQYLVQRAEGLSASRSRGVRASIRILLEADEHGRLRRRVGSPPSTPVWFGPISTPYLQFIRTHRGLAAKTERKCICRTERVSVPGKVDRDPRLFRRSSKAKLSKTRASLIGSTLIRGVQGARSTK
jgi:hypothetical protein